ncbi:MAG TPA: DUF6691 family protein [Candidatus Binatia bacterium]|nr:DUF6691 family protein [Candidatus Binatia bacterium]
MKTIVISFLTGIIFALGLGIGGMTQPAKVVGFLDFGGNWDPSLAFVMIGAIGIYSFSYWVLRKGFSFASTSSLMAPTKIDARLIGGSALFGVGWGIAGICPGPAITALASQNRSFWIFFYSHDRGDRGF